MAFIAGSSVYSAALASSPSRFFTARCLGRRRPGLRWREPWPDVAWSLSSMRTTSPSKETRLSTDELLCLCWDGS
eukprot:6758913-Pyramimonas_sp.AAC.1